MTLMLKVERVLQNIILKYLMIQLLKVKKKCSFKNQFQTWAVIKQMLEIAKDKIRANSKTCSIK